MQNIDSFNSGSEDECLAVIGFALTKKQKHRMWVRDGSNYNLVKEMAMGDREMYFKYMRMTPGRMEHLFNLVAPRITKLSTNYRQPIPQQQRPSLTLRHLATGESHISLSLQYRIGCQTVSKIIPETCKAIYDVLTPTYVNMPTSSDEWLAVSKQFEVKWNLPHVIGAIDGKHIRMRGPDNTGSLYYIYKVFFSMVLLAVCDANDCFTMFDLGQYGSNNDSGVLMNSELDKKLEQDALSIPQDGCFVLCTLDGCFVRSTTIFFGRG